MITHNHQAFEVFAPSFASNTTFEVELSARNLHHIQAPASETDTLGCLLAETLRMPANQALRQSSSSGRPLRSIAPKPPPPSSADETGENENAETEPTRGEPRGEPSPPPLSFIAWTPHRPPLQPQPAADQADEDEPAIDRPSLGRPSAPLPSWSARSTRPLRTLRPKPDTSSSPQPEPAEPTTHYELLSRRLLSPSRTAVSAPSPVVAPTPSIISPASAPTSKTASPIAQASPPLAVHHPFWGPGAAEVLPCDESGTIRDAYKRARIREVELLQGRARAPYWTVRHIQEVCADVHRMPASARAGFGDLHKQLRELYDFHAHVMGLYAPPWAHPDDVVAVEGAGLETMLPRVLRDFVLGMSEHLLGVWRPFSRERVDWNVHSKHSFLEDFSCFLQFHNKFYGQRVILMQAPAAPGWSEQGSLRFYDNIRFRGYLEREETGLTKYETERKSFVDCFWDT
ncbi:hypothetical protein LMH87_011133 [Akanthomyces muscarius]|uniref:Uncharacterized protein n=1 Tax=Akanthomyces muscarius TaxID=2231603 RepID=A0A9W8UKN0_AKAMU|nr:hypothetical protein LMH87_011133 [Akanthomyces muscarius]KAJ4150381.1 hypothetical protein LMH87_011133 [Akanthomyces muscarius]